MYPQVLAGSFFAQTTPVLRSRLCQHLTVAAIAENAPIIVEQVQHADLLAVAPEVPPTLVPVRIKSILKDDTATSAALIHLQAG